MRLRDDIIADHIAKRGAITRKKFKGKLLIIFGMDNVGWTYSKVIPKQMWIPSLDAMTADDYEIVDLFWERDRSCLQNGTWVARLARPQDLNDLLGPVPARLIATVGSPITRSDPAQLFTEIVDAFAKEGLQPDRFITSNTFVHDMVVVNYSRAREFIPNELIDHIISNDQSEGFLFGFPVCYTKLLDGSGILIGIHNGKHENSICIGYTYSETKPTK